jgi:hypothetical protein
MAGETPTRRAQSSCPILKESVKKCKAWAQNMLRGQGCGSEFGWNLEMITKVWAGRQKCKWGWTSLKELASSASGS